MSTPATTSAQMYIQSAEYLNTVEQCWSKSCFYQQKQLMKQFLVLQSSDTELLPGRITLEDMSDWLISQRKLIPERLRVATSEEGINLAHLTSWVNTNLMMRTMELQASGELNDNLSQTNQNLNSSNLSYLADGVKAEVVRGLRTISRTVAFQPVSRLSCSADVLVDLVPRLLLSLTNQPAQTPWDDSVFLALSNLAVTMVLEVLDRLPSTLQSPAPKVQYSKATGIYMVRTILRRIHKLCNIEEFNSDLYSWSPSLISSMTQAVTTQVQKLVEKPPDFILAETVFSWLSKNGAKAEKICVLPENPHELVLHLETIRTIIGLAVIQIYDGEIEPHVDLQNWPVIVEVQNKLAVYNLKVSKKAEKVNWHLNTQDVVKIATQIHNYIHSYFGSKLNMKMALSARVHLMTRAMAHVVVQQILTLRETAYYEDVDDEDDDDFSDDILKYILILFLEKFLPVTNGMGDRLKCVSLAALISAMVLSITDRARKTSMLFQKLEELKIRGGLVPLADTLYGDYMSRCFSPLALSLETFWDREKSLLVANMLADKLLGHVPPRLSRATTHFELKPTAESWGRAKADKWQTGKTATLFDDEATQMGTNQEKFEAGRATAELQSANADVVVKPKKKSRIARFFRRIF